MGFSSLSAEVQATYVAYVWQQELVHGHIDVIFIESREKSSFQVNSRIDRAAGQAPEPIKGYPFKGVDE